MASPWSGRNSGDGKESSKEKGFGSKLVEAKSLPSEFSSSLFMHKLGKVAKEAGPV